MSSDEPAERLKVARQGAGFLSAADAARAHGWKVVTYRHHENGTRAFPAKVATDYAKAYSVSVGWLLGDNPGKSYAEAVQSFMYTDAEIDGANDYSNNARERYGAVLLPLVNLSDMSVSEKEFVDFFAIDASVIDQVAEGRSATPFTFMAVKIDTDYHAKGLSVGDIVILDRATSKVRQQGKLSVYSYASTPSVHGVFHHADGTVELLDVGQHGASVRVARKDVIIWGTAIWIVQRI